MGGLAELGSQGLGATADGDSESGQCGRIDTHDPWPAVRTRDVPSAQLLHADCGERIRYAKQCPVHGTVDGAAIVRGYEYGPGRHVIAQPDELDALRPVQDKALRLERFLTQDQLNPMLFAGRSLY